MPLYDFECECGKTTEKYFLLANLQDSIRCSCGKDAIRVISLGRGGILRDEPVWIDNQFRELVQSPNDHKNPIVTRTELNRHLKETGQILL